ncbi:MAG: YfcE family phosphodiesterase [Candidatus Falkowbacteria bacterium]|nr:YfcE family phosphodiesterase [Candidatus Falkowbacteria bacterium]
MKIAIFSDLHDDGNNLKKFLDFCQKEKIKTLIFCGDLANQETLGYLADNFLGKIFMVGGNADLFGTRETKKYSNIIFSPDVIEVHLGKLNFVAIHKPKDLIKFLSKKNISPDFAFHGHTHRPDIKETGKTTIANPGTLNGPEYQASFATLDCATKKLSLNILSKI